jgi:hypothetical protein
MRSWEIKKMINDLGYCILHLLYVLLLEKLYISNRYIATKLSKYIWSDDIFVKYEFCKINKRVNPIMWKWEMRQKKKKGFGSPMMDQPNLY